MSEFILVVLASTAERVVARGFEVTVSLAEGLVALRDRGEMTLVLLMTSAGPGEKLTK